MSAPTLNDVLENDRASLDAAVLNEEIEVRERIIELKTIAYEKKKKQEEMSRETEENEVRKASQEERLAAAYKISNIVDDTLDPDEEVTKNTFYERCKLLQQKSDLMDDEINNAQENCDMQTIPFNKACKILFQLRRLETCCSKMELWSEENYTGEFDATQAEVDLAEEELIAEHIRELLDKRDEELGRIEVVMNKIETASGTLKRGFQVDKSIKPDGKLTEGARSYERSICRENDGNDGVVDIYDRGEFVSKRTKDRLRRYRRERNELYCKNKALKATIKNDTIALESDKTQQVRRKFADSCVSVGANGSMNNAVFKSTLDNLTHQLELEGNSQALASDQFAISDRRGRGQPEGGSTSPSPANPRSPGV